MTTISEIKSLHSRELQKRATLMGISNSRHIPKEELIAKCIEIIESQNAEKAAIKKEKKVIKEKKLVSVSKATVKLKAEEVAEVKTVLESKVESVKKAPILEENRMSKFKAVKKEKPTVSSEVERHPMEKGDFLQYYPAKRAFPITTKILSVFREILDNGKNNTWIEDDKGNIISEIGKNWWHTYRAAIKMKNENPLYKGFKITTYWSKAK